mmetsp:Transcript_65719/g.174163  ORF Transcript_65719/g.174163 Transcript_65719/m.174163 type:complete len:280 (+) Transcript_65719:622-1461(+)
MGEPLRLGPSAAGVSVASAPVRSLGSSCAAVLPALWESGGSSLSLRRASEATGESPRRRLAAGGVGGEVCEASVADGIKPSQCLGTANSIPFSSLRARAAFARPCASRSPLSKPWCTVKGSVVPPTTIQHAASSSSQGPPSRCETSASRASSHSRSKTALTAAEKAARLYASTDRCNFSWRVRFTATTPSSPSSGGAVPRSVKVRGAVSRRTALRIALVSASSGTSVSASGPSRAIWSWRPCISKFHPASSLRENVSRSSASSMRKRTVRVWLAETRNT